MPNSSIFLDINLPNPTTWFYFSGLLAVALFFKFSRLLSMRNVDVLTLYLFMPGLLLLADYRYLLTDRSFSSLRTASVPDEALAKLQPLREREFESREELSRQIDAHLSPGERERYRETVLEHSLTAPTFWGYLWLLVASAYFLVRCLFDLALVRRPALASNLDLAGMIWLAGALFVSLVAVAARQPVTDNNESARTPLGNLPKLSEKVIGPYAPADVDHSHLGVWVERGWALLCHLSVALGLALIGWRHFDDLRAGMSAATFYLLLPYTFLLLPDSPLGVGRWDHAWPMALAVWAIFSYRRPVLAGAFLGFATVPAFFLIVTLPVWCGFYFRRGACRFLVSFALFAGVGLIVLGGLAWIFGELPAGLQSDWTKFVWQPWKRPDSATPGIWRDIPSQAAYRVPVFVASMALVLVAGLWPYPKNLAHVIALSAATLISIQFWYAGGGVYVLWFLPLLLLLTFRPNLVSSQPPPAPTDDWLARLGARLGARLRRLVRRPQPRTQQA
jgi:hypothetical protein